MRYLAIDIGASSGRHIVCSMEGGKLVTEEVYRFPNAPQKKNGALVWDVDRLFEEVLNGLRRAGELGKRPDCVGIDTWAVDYALLDERGERIGDVYCYRDGRTADAVEKVHEIVPFADLYARTGIQFQPFNTIYQLYADRCSGKLQHAAGMLMLPDYLGYLLTGVRRQEYTNATSTGLVGAVSHVWDETLISALGLPQGLFGGLTQPGAKVGTFTNRVREAVGYQATLLLPATHDTASAVLAAPLRAQTPYLSSGTWSLLGVEQNEAHTDEQSRRYNYSNEGSIGHTFRYQKNIMGLWMVQQIRSAAAPQASFEELMRLARRNPVPYTVDVNDARFLAPENMLDEVCAAAGRKLALGEALYCVFQSLAADYARAIEEIEAMTCRKYETLNIIGGGSKNALLNELTQKMTGKKVITGPAEGTAIGNVIMQMIGCGELADLPAAREAVANSFDIEEVTI